MRAGMNDTPSGERIHIGFFGRRNAGKSSLVNAVSGQELAIVSQVAGTTTDPVYKAMELLPLGPVTLIDTAGLDDKGQLGEMRVARTRQVLNKTDIAVLVADGTVGLTDEDRALLDLIRAKGIPHLTVMNKCDQEDVPGGDLCVSARTGRNVTRLKERIAALARPEENKCPLIADLIASGDLVVLVVPIDSAAPKGRLILPQQQVIRAVLDAGAMVVVTRESELETALERLNAPARLVVTDSQAFGRVSSIVPEQVPLTSFSILFARYKGDLELTVRGAAALDRVKNGDRILISEGCTHHRQCDDIGTVKLPRWIRDYTGAEPEFCFTSGTEFPEDLSPYHMVIHCGGCMLNTREMRYRQRNAQNCGVPITNYGVAIAHLHGILARSVAPFPQIAALLTQP